MRDYNAGTEKKKCPRDAIKKKTLHGANFLDGVSFPKKMSTFLCKYLVLFTRGSNRNTE